jgi:hypothetical protein
MTKQSRRSGDDTNASPLFTFEKPDKADEASEEANDDDYTAPTAAPSRSVDSADDVPLEEEQYQASEEAEDDDTASFPPQSLDVFRDATSTTTKNKNTTDISIAPTFPSHGALGRFDSDYGDEESQDVGEEGEESSFLGDDTPSDDDREELEGGGEAVSSLPQATETSEGRRSSNGNGINNSGAFVPQSFRPFQSRNSEVDPYPINPNMTDFAATVGENACASNNNTAPQCRHTPTIITSSEASYIFHQLDELRMTSPSGITYNKPKYLQPTSIINGNEFADSLPIDAIHAISSYCDGKSWMALCHTSKQWRGVGYEVWRKVRMHAFRCASEVLLAWVSCFSCVIDM